MKPIKVNLFGMELEEWKCGDSVARFAVGENGHPWAILYDIESEHYGLGHATELLREAKKYYEKQGRSVGGPTALNPIMQRIYKRIGYYAYP